jgi:hypothetical protein
MPVSPPSLLAAALLWKAQADTVVFRLLLKTDLVRTSLSSSSSGESDVCDSLEGSKQTRTNERTDKSSFHSRKHILLDDMDRRQHAKIVTNKYIHIYVYIYIYIYIPPTIPLPSQINSSTLVALGRGTGGPVVLLGGLAHPIVGQLARVPGPYNLVA